MQEVVRRDNSFVSLDGVTIRFVNAGTTVTAVDGITFGVSRGEKFVVLGPSGCGKSTLLKAIAGFVNPTLGVIRVDGQSLREPGPDRVMVFQEFDQLLPWKTVLNNVQYALRIATRLSRSETAERANEYLQLVGLAEFRNAYPHTLSGGMKQRVAIARALALDPSVLLMDEPFASLDAITRTRMQEDLNRLWERTQKTILFVTHSIDEALILGQHILVLSSRPGRVRAVLRNPAGDLVKHERDHSLEQEIRDLLRDELGDKSIGSKGP